MYFDRPSPLTISIPIDESNTRGFAARQEFDTSEYHLLTCYNTRRFDFGGKTYSFDDRIPRRRNAVIGGRGEGTCGVWGWRCGRRRFYYFSRDGLAFHPHVVPATGRAAVARKTRLTAFWCRRRRRFYTR